MKSKHFVKITIHCQSAEEMQKAKEAVLYHLETLNPEFQAVNNTLTVSVPPLDPQIKPMALIESMSKKVCEHSDVYFRTNKKTGKVYTGKLCNPSTKEPSAAQTAAKARFAKVSAAVRTILAGTSEQKTALEAEYNAQNKIGSLFGYAMKKLNDQYDQNGDPIGG